MADEKNSLTGQNNLVERVKGILMKPKAETKVTKITERFLTSFHAYSRGRNPARQIPFQLG